MQLIESTLPGAVIIEPTVHSDVRGWFMESFHAARFHAGARAAQRSAAWGVAVNLRRSSLRFGRWVGGGAERTQPQAAVDPARVCAGAALG